MKINRDFYGRDADDVVIEAISEMSSLEYM